MKNQFINKYEVINIIDGDIQSTKSSYIADKSYREGLVTGLETAKKHLINTPVYSIKMRHIVQRKEEK